MISRPSLNGSMLHIAENRTDCDRTRDARAQFAACAGLLLAALALFLVVPAMAHSATAAELQARQGALGGQIDTLSGRIHALQGKIDNLQSHENTIQADLDQKVAKEQQVSSDLTASRTRLANLKKKLAYSKKILGQRVVAIYKAGNPDILNIVLNAHGFAQMVERATYLKQISEQDQGVITSVSTLKTQTATETVKLASLETQAKQLVAQVQSRRDQVASAKGALASRQGGLQAQLAKNKKTFAVVAAAVNRNQASVGPQNSPTSVLPSAPQTYTSPTLSGHVGLNGDGTASAPVTAPGAIQAAVAAGNRIASLPYIWGGGHGSFNAAGYDCSGSVSYVLHAAGVLSSPEASGPLESWGAPGPGKWITVYANAGHAFMTVGGLWFDTSGANPSRWQSGSKPTGGFVVRHYPGL